MVEKLRRVQLRKVKAKKCLLKECALFQKIIKIESMEIFEAGDDIPLQTMTTTYFDVDIEKLEYCISKLQSYYVMKAIREA